MSAMKQEMAFCGCSRDDWPEWVKINTDLPPDATYDNWVSNIKQFRERIAAQGGIAVQIDVKPAEFLAWCQANGRDVNSSARANYAAFRFAQLKRDGD